MKKGKYTALSPLQLREEPLEKLSLSTGVGVLMKGDMKTYTKNNLLVLLKLSHEGIKSNQASWEYVKK